MRIRPVGSAALAVMLAAVAACADDDDDDRRGGRANAGICTPFAAQAAPSDPSGVAAPAAPGGTEAAAFDDCLHRWGYRLARSGDPADLVAEAAVHACVPALTRWNQATLSQMGAGPDTAVSLVTGATNNTPGERFQAGVGKALFYVVQARAGNCTPPPAATAGR